VDDRLERLIRWSQGEALGPYQIEIHPTNICNMDCIMCGTMTTFRKLEAADPHFHRSMSRQWAMPDKRFFTLVEESARFDVQRWLITGGGEPLMRKRATLGMVRRIKEHGMFGNMNTNGSLFNEKDVRLFVAKGWDMIMFSVDSHVPGVHDFIRRLPGGFKLMEKTLRTFQKVKREMGSDKPKVVFNSVLTNRNYNQLNNILEFCADVGGEDVTFIPLIDFVPAFDTDLRLSDAQREELRGYIPLVKERSRELGIHTNIETIVPEKIQDTAAMDTVILIDLEREDSGSEDGSFASLPCYEPYLNLVIRMTGAVGPCCMLENREVSVRDRSLEDVWRGSFFRRLRESMEQKQLFGACKNCVYMQMIGNGELRHALRKSGMIT